MAKRHSVPRLKRALTNERRKNKRLRALIDELRSGIYAVSDGVRANRKELDVQLRRLAQLQAEVDLLKGR